MAKKKRSKLEVEVGAVLEAGGFDYEPFTVPYHIPKKYTPDFTLGNVLVEVKGWFRPGDTQKYKAVNDSIAVTDQELVFVLQTPNKKVRKGTQMTMSDWCEKHDILWFCPDTLDELIDYATTVTFYEEDEDDADS